LRSGPARDEIDDVRQDTDTDGRQQAMRARPWARLRLLAELPLRDARAILAAQRRLDVRRHALVASDETLQSAAHEASGGSSLA